MIVTCQYKNHQIDTANDGSVYHYSDPENGVPGSGIKICHDCYLEHLQKFYPDSNVTIELIRRKETE